LKAYLHFVEKNNYKMQSSNKINNTHCKIQCGTEFRRFLLPSIRFSDLEAQIRSAFGFAPEKPLVIKYTDEEGDNVTISSDEELQFAIELFAEKLLRLTIVCQNKCPQVWGQAPVTIPNKPFPHHAPHQAPWGHGPWGHGQSPLGGPHGHGSFGPHGHGHGPHGRQWESMGDCTQKWECRGKRDGQFWKAKWDAKLLSNPDMLKNKIEKLQNKQIKMKERLQWLEKKAATDFNPSLPHRMSHFQAKIASVESRLSHLQNLSTQNHQNPQPIPSAEVQTPAVPTPAEAPSAKEQIIQKKMQMGELRERVKAGTLPRNEAAEQIFVLKEEIGKLREAHREKMAAKRLEGRCGRKNH
jgi:hypothetical protein